MISIVGTREVSLHRKQEAIKLREMPKCFSSLCKMTHKLTSSDVVGILLLLCLACSGYSWFSSAQTCSERWPGGGVLGKSTFLYLPFQ